MILLLRQRLEWLGKTALQVPDDFNNRQLSTTSQTFREGSMVNKQTINALPQRIDQPKQVLNGTIILALLSQGMLAHDNNIREVLLQLSLERGIDYFNQAQFEQPKHHACNTRLWQHQDESHPLQGNFTV